MSLAISDVVKEFETGSRRVPVLRGASLTLADGESAAIVGPSGSGKSTLLHIAGTLESPDAGGVRIDDTDPFALGGEELARFRNRAVGFVFQDHYLLPQYTVLENTLIPALAFADGAQRAPERARELLERVGLGHRLDHRPAELSGGERQRVAIARALVNGPSLVLCDEPTGNLDRATAESVADLLIELHERERGVLAVVTHSGELAARFPRRFELRDGRCYED